ncbi:MAG: hypothetical protein RIM84_04695 [Alphaproteobacteria bacterium]
MAQPAEELRTDPFSVYPTPAAVLADDTLPTSGKLQVLRAMEEDLVALERAEGEAMASPDPDGGDDLGDQLAAVRGAIMDLSPRSEAHGDSERERKISDAKSGAHLTVEEARQGEPLFKTTGRRNSFLIYIAAAIAVFALIAFFARPWA